MKQHRIINLLKEDVEDKIFLDLVNKLFHVGILSLNKNLYPDFYKEISLESVLSTIFLNLYFLGTGRLDDKVKYFLSESGRPSCFELAASRLGPILRRILFQAR